MPNQRKSGKANVTAWVPDALKAELSRIAKARGIPLSEVVETMLREQARRYKETGHGYDVERSD